MKKFIGFNVVVFLVLLIIFSYGANMENYIYNIYAGNSYLNPVLQEHYYFTGMIFEVFSAIGVLIQLVFVSKKLAETK